MARKTCYRALILGIAGLAADGLVAAEIARSKNAVPDEYVSTGEHTTALANGGSLSSGGYAAVRANPAMLAVDKQYTLGGGWHWPSQGRNYYQAGVVDSKTASIAAGASYTSSMDDYQGPWDEQGRPLPSDSPVKRRVNLGLAQNFRTFSLGFSGSYVEAADPLVTFSEDAPRARGFTLGAGLVVGLAQNLRAGISVENMANKNIDFAAPTIYRVGFSWAALQDASVFVDYRRRDAVPVYDAPPPNLAIVDKSEDTVENKSAEQTVTAGANVRIYDLLRFSAAAGMLNDGASNVSTVAGGLALVNKGFSLGYGVHRPDMRYAGVHHAASLGIDVSL